MQGADGLDFRTKKQVRYDDKRIHERSRVISLAIDARQQRYPEEPLYVYQPLVGEEEENRWSEETRQTVLKDYNLNDLSI